METNCIAQGLSGEAAIGLEFSEAVVRYKPGTSHASADLEPSTKATYHSALVGCTAMFI